MERVWGGVWRGGLNEAFDKQTSEESVLLFVLYRELSFNTFGLVCVLDAPLSFATVKRKG